MRRIGTMCLLACCLLLFGVQAALAQNESMTCPWTATYAPSQAEILRNCANVIDSTDKAAARAAGVARSTSTDCRWGRRYDTTIPGLVCLDPPAAAWGATNADARPAGLAMVPETVPGSPAQVNENTLVTAVREATQGLRDVEAAEAAGYGPFLGCVSGPQGGAMGVHYPNGSLVADGELNASQPEVLVFEPRAGRLELAGVEYLVLYDGWHANHEGPPTLLGQVFNYVSSPNRYGMPAFYELHVWAWKNNPDGVFADWHPMVSCAQYAE